MYRVFCLEQSLLIYLLNLIECTLTICIIQGFFCIATGDTVHSAVLSSAQNHITKTLFNPLNPELNPICYLLALLAHHFLHISRIRVKSLTLRLLMSYIYIQGGTGGMCQTSGGCSLC